MNIVLSESSSLNPGLIEELAALENINVYLSVSYADTVRIIRDIKPEVIIIESDENGGMDYAHRIFVHFPDLRIVLYDTTRKNHFTEIRKDHTMHTVSIQNMMSNLSFIFTGNYSLNI